LDTTELKRLLTVLYRQLNILQEREAKYGGNVPLELLNQIDDHQRAIALVIARLKDEISAEELEEKLAPLNLSLDRGQSRFTIGSNFIQIGTLTIPAVPLILIALSALGLFGVVSYAALAPTPTPTLMPTPTPGPTRMSGLFNVAVAQFGEVNSKGHVQASSTGTQLSQWIFEGLKLEFDNLPLDLRKEFQPQLWHDSLGPTEKGIPLGPILGDTPEARKEAAQKLAATIGADVIIYGNLALNQDPATFTPEFYVAGLKYQADEVEGRHQLGAPIPVQPPLDPNDRQANRALNRKLALRAEALSRFTIGLMYDLEGASSDALAVFEAMEQDLADWQEKDEGKEILYYFIGRQALFLSRNTAEAAKVGQSVDELIIEAEKYFQLALDSKADYSRARIGLASAYYQRAQLRPAEERLSTPDLANAIKEYQQALAEAVQSADTLTASKAHVGLGVAYRLKGEAYYLTGADEDANFLFNQAIEKLETALPVLAEAGQFRLMGQAYLTLGVAYAQQARIKQDQGDKVASMALYEQALTAYDRCIAQKEQAPNHRVLTEEIIAGACQPYRQKSQEALQALRGG
jgi:tetratricopeptide (TPR) repeat protein